MENKVNTKIPVIFQNLEQYEANDTRFMKVKIWLMHTNLNLNNSWFDKEVVDKYLHTLANTPILAFIEENSSGEKDFSDHRLVLERDEEGNVKLAYKGQAIGLIPETNNAKWETRVSDSGEELEYLTVEGLIWTKWDDPIDIMNRKGFTSQSMELHDTYEGYWDDNGVFHFTKFSFFGACLLGDDVLPAMKSSTAELQFSSNKNIQKTIEDKLEEFKSLFSKEGGKSVEEVKQEFEEQVTETTESEVVETEIQVEDVTEETVVTETEETFEQTDTETTEQVETVEEQVKEESYATEEDVNEEVVEETFSKEFVDGLQSQIESLSTELSELKSYKRQREEQDLASKFADKLTENEIKEVFESTKDSSLDVVEEKLLATFGKKNFSLVEEKPSSKVKLNINKTVEQENPYKDFFS